MGQPKLSGSDLLSELILISSPPIGPCSEEIIYLFFELNSRPWTFLCPRESISYFFVLMFIFKIFPNGLLPFCEIPKY